MTPPQARNWATLLLQVVLFGLVDARQIASEAGSLRSGRLPGASAPKLIRRHFPHVFAGAVAADTAAVARSWEAIKAEEPGQGTAHARQTASPLSDRLASKAARANPPLAGGH